MNIMLLVSKVLLATGSGFLFPGCPCRFRLYWKLGSRILIQSEAKENCSEDKRGGEEVWR